MKKKMGVREKKQRSQFRTLNRRIMSCDYTLSMAQVRRWEELNAKFKNRG